MEREKKRKIHKKYNIVMALFMIGLFCSLTTGCATTPLKNKEAQDKPGYINDVKLYYASEIEDRGWQLEDYKMESGDVLNISVWQIAELEKIVVVRPDGKFSFPLIGDVEARGKTIEQLRTDLEERLGKYIRVPQASVIVESFGGKRAIIIDEAGGGGIIRFAEPIRIIEALAMAGGYNKDINLHKIYVIRGGQIKDDQPKIIIVDAHKIFREADMRENILVRSDDIIFLARGWLATITDFIDQLDTVKTELNKVVGQANYYRNIDNIVPWNKAVDIDLPRDKGRRVFTKGDWDIGQK